MVLLQSGLVNYSQTILKKIFGCNKEPKKPFQFQPKTLFFEFFITPKLFFSAAVFHIPDFGDATHISLWICRILPGSQSFSRAEYASLKKTSNARRDDSLDPRLNAQSSHQSFLIDRFCSENYF